MKTRRSTRVRYALLGVVFEENATAEQEGWRVRLQWDVSF